MHSFNFHNIGEIEMKDFRKWFWEVVFPISAPSFWATSSMQSTAAARCSNAAQLLIIGKIPDILKFWTIPRHRDNTRDAIHISPEL